jgi:glutamine cyclotransferase
VKYKNGDNDVFMLTWKERKAFRLNNKLELQSELDIPPEIEEGWGMTSYLSKDSEPMLLISDGTNRLYHVDPVTFKVKKTVSVKLENGNELNKLNELEFMGDGTVMANIYETPLIA